MTNGAAERRNRGSTRQILLGTLNQNYVGGFITESVWRSLVPILAKVANSKYTSIAII
ncbi:hypothetical protein [Chamaesiphon sp. OTE_20_metabat_361]|uniref:hypothetical protein n=1 Tax=Chamaesiphon sp. OTE_20_metabat_361 TaxID=2964689 RepID=UPI00286CBC2D|nr:hypothetical protein [Chamaesiphon sp. OTE_20_metabat_361]